MDLRHMRHFVAVAEELHFGRAALRLNMAQPPLSQSIRRLELDIGVELFDRSRRSVELTPAGRVFLQEARRTLQQSELARKMAVREAAEVPEVRVSFVGPALYRLLPDLLVRYRAAQPDVHIRLFERSSPDQVRGVHAGDFDVAFANSRYILRGGECQALLVERAPFIAAVPADWPIARRGAVTLAELAEEPFIGPPSQFSDDAPEAQTMFQAAGVMPRVTQEAIQTNTTISLVGAGLGCSAVIATAALMHVPNVRFLPISDAPATPCWELMMTWHPGQIGRLGAGFIAFARDYVDANPQLLDLNAPIV